MARRPIAPTAPTFSPREDLPGQTDLIPSLDALAAEARAGARHNGGPPLAPEPSYETLARIGKPVFGDLWDGKIAAIIHQHPRQMRRWRDGQGRPTRTAIGWAQEWARTTAEQLLRAAGEADLADAVAARNADLARQARKRGRASIAKAPSGINPAN